MRSCLNARQLKPGMILNINNKVIQIFKVTKCFVCYYEYDDSKACGCMKKHSKKWWNSHR